MGVACHGWNIKGTFCWRQARIHEKIAYCNFPAIAFAKEFCFPNTQECSVLSRIVVLRAQKIYKCLMKEKVCGVQKISVLVSERESERFEAYCKEYGYKKSTLIARLVREHLDRENFQAQKLSAPSKARKTRS